jgi:hypothetical protein
MEPGGLLLNSRESAISPDPEPNKIQSIYLSYILNNHFNIIVLFKPGVFEWSLCLI